MIKPSFAALCVAFTLAAPARAELPSYRTTVLQALQSGDQVTAFGFNDAGVVVGNSASERFGRMDAVIWDTAGIPSLLSLPDASYPRSSGISINNQGEVLGWRGGERDEPDYVYRGMRFVNRDGQSRDIATLSPDFFAHSMNDAGQLIGGKVLNRDGTLRDIHIPYQHSLYDMRINNSGIVAGSLNFNGYDDDPTTDYHAAAIWRGEDIYILKDAQVLDLDNHGRALLMRVGKSRHLGQALWDGQQLIDIPPSTLGGDFLAMNDRGDLVGVQWESYVEPDFHFARINGQDINLNDLLDPALRAAGWELMPGYMDDSLEINEQGQILASTRNPLTNAYGAVVFTPIPEPGTFALSLLGLSGLMLAVRRARSGAAA